MVSKNIKRIGKACLPAILLVLSGCDSSPSVRTNSTKYSTNELGTLQVLGPTLNAASNAVKQANRHINNAEKAKGDRNFGVADSHYKKANKILYAWRSSIYQAKKRAKAQRLPTIIYPASMHELELAVYDLYHRIPASLPEHGNLNQQHLNSLLIGLRNLVGADARFAAKVRKRRSNPDIVKPKAILAIEVRPFPFKLEVLHGEFKIKQTVNFGPIGAEMGLATGGTTTGVTRLRLVHEGQLRVYAIGNRKLSFEVPASRVDVDGRVMTITTL